MAHVNRVAPIFGYAHISYVQAYVGGDFTSTLLTPDIHCPNCGAVFSKLRLDFDRYLPEIRAQRHTLCWQLGKPPELSAWTAASPDCKADSSFSHSRPAPERAVQELPLKRTGTYHLFHTAAGRDEVHRRSFSGGSCRWNRRPTIRPVCHGHPILVNNESALALHNDVYKGRSGSPLDRIPSRRYSFSHLYPA